MRVCRHNVNRDERDCRRCEDRERLEYLEQELAAARAEVAELKARRDYLTRLLEHVYSCTNCLWPQGPCAEYRQIAPEPVGATTVDPNDRCAGCGHPLSEHGDLGCKWGCAWGCCDLDPRAKRGAAVPDCIVCHAQEHGETAHVPLCYDHLTVCADLAVEIKEIDDARPPAPIGADEEESE